jgi:hypothetical protein
MHSRSHKGDNTFKLNTENVSQTIQVRKEMAEGTNNLCTTRILVFQLPGLGMCHARAQNATKLGTSFALHGNPLKERDLPLQGATRNTPLLELPQHAQLSAWTKT